ncbi:class I SAM-dependent methyltransferase [Halorarius litoreus]|uniref:class I SAM-dependent methyltransferase n=1 Tax=Halorarius litoreus TaxID=2962676 RepID=UPI0020CC3CA3|nr:methyltransferase domain-containing protein [Halorarius litoreus]
MSVREFYGRYADLYDRIATFPGVSRWRRAAAVSLDLSPGDTVVEFGCGSGANLPHLREQVGPEGEVVGVDFTRPLLDRARDRAPDAHLVCGDATAPAVASADAVLGTFVCGMFQSPAEVVADWCSLVGPGGNVALLDATTSPHPVGRLCNPLFRAFARGTAPAESTRDAALAAVTGEADTVLDQRVAAARATVVARTRHRRFERFGLGFVGLLSGEVIDDFSP